MAVNKKEVAHIARLANLALSEHEVARYQAQLSDIIQYFDTLRRLPADETAQPWSAPKEHLPLREDQRHASLPADRAIQNARETKRHQFQVPRVFETD